MGVQISQAIGFLLALELQQKILVCTPFHLLSSDNFFEGAWLAIAYGVSELFTSLKRGHDGRKHIVFIKMYAYLAIIWRIHHPQNWEIWEIWLFHPYKRLIEIVTEDLISIFRVEIWRFLTRKKNHLLWVSCITIHDTLTADNNLSLRLEFVSQSNKFLIIMSWYDTWLISFRDSHDRFQVEIFASCE